MTDSYQLLSKISNQGLARLWWRLNSSQWRSIVQKLLFYEQLFDLRERASLWSDSGATDFWCFHARICMFEIAQTHFLAKLFTLVAPVGIHTRTLWILLVCFCRSLHGNTKQVSSSLTSAGHWRQLQSERWPNLISDDWRAVEPLFGNDSVFEDRTDWRRGERRVDEEGRDC